MKEIYKKISDFNDYEVSNFGNVKSKKFNKNKILKPSLDGDGYLKVNLYKENKRHTKKIHILVSNSFLHNEVDNNLVVDHINNNPRDNKLTNLQLITKRENCSKDAENKYSKLTGVSYSKRRRKFTSSIRINGKLFFLGYFNNEKDAFNSYQNKLKEIDSIK